MKIAIFPFAKTLRVSDKKHPKNYPWWPELITILQGQGHEIIQVGVEDEPQLVNNFQKGLSFDQLEQLIKSCDTWIGVDSFGQHFCWDIGVRGVAIFGQSDPNIFGHVENINLLKSRSYLRDKQFWLWDQADYREDCFPSPEEIAHVIQDNFSPRQ